jgi:hypothetical protein
MEAAAILAELVGELPAGVRAIVVTDDCKTCQLLLPHAA